MKTTIILIIAIVQLIFGTTSLIAQSTTDKIDNYLTEGIVNGFSGSILIASEGQIVLNKAYGMADRESGISYMPNTVSTIGSVTKQFTATAILKLEALNKLKVTDPLSHYFKKLPKDKMEITLHQLLTHTSGFIDGIGEGDFDNIPMDRFFKTLFATKLLHEPGSKHAYSNAGYSILARIIEISSGQEYENFLNEQLFIPAGMKQTGYFIPEWDIKTIATGYALSIVNVGTMISRYQKSGEISWNLKGNGGIHSTTTDMYKWYQALKNGKILSPTLFQKLTTPYVLEQEGGSSHYAYGWAIYNSERNTKIISHNGGNSIFFHDYIFLPVEDLIIILFTNSSSREVEVAWQLKKMIFDQDYQAKPIKKNLFLMVFDFIKSNDTDQINDLISKIINVYGPSLKSPDQLNSLAYRILNNEIMDIEENAKWAVAIFKLNTELFPKDGNIWDSLGEGYFKNGQKQEAISSYQKALDLAPNKQCDWFDSSTKALKQLKKK